MPTKKNKAGYQQPYIPAKNGKTSGTYTYNQAYKETVKVIKMAKTIKK